MRRHRYERRLRARVKRESGCLASLPSDARELLGLRAGLDGAPRTRAEAASELGISRRAAARLEHSGLRELHVACGGGSGGGRSGAVNARFASLANDSPDLQPAVYLPISDAPELQKPKGRVEVKGETATASPPAATPAAATVKAAISADETHGLVVALLVAAGLAALGATSLVTLRRRAVATEAAAPIPVVITPPAEPVKPVVIQRPAPPKPPVTVAPPTTNTTTSPKLARSASVVASAAASFAVRELVRRSRRRR